ncbi:MAG TPA: GTPase HflX, partial [Solirubrobacteraceae bacterium]|nr:GTPase HflX [Solirubrobacteraceae bacterium]
MQRSRNGRSKASNSSSENGRAQGRARQRAYLIAALSDHGADDLTELRELLRTAGVAGVGEMIQHLEHPHPNTYLGAGKLNE